LIVLTSGTLPRYNTPPTYRLIRSWHILPSKVLMQQFISFACKVMPISSLAGVSRDRDMKFIVKCSGQLCSGVSISACGFTTAPGIVSLSGLPTFSPTSLLWPNKHGFHITSLWNISGNGMPPRSWQMR